MKRSTLLWIALLTLMAATFVRVQIAGVTNIRGVRVTNPSLEPAASFDRAQSAALFVGVQEFDDRTIARVPYAADDAVDLAYAFAMDSRVALVNPDRVVIALSGAPRKKASRDHLAELRAAGAIVTGAGREEIMTRLRQQAAAAGSGGLLILSFATHGFNSEGTPYVLGSTSLLGDPVTALPTTSLIETAATSPARRSLVFVDACRDRMTANTRAGEDPTTGAPLIAAMRHVEGQVVFYAAAAGGYAYDDPRRRNGVFTAAVVDGLQCQAASNASGVVTVDALHAFVETRVRAWVQRNQGRTARGFIQVVMDGDTKRMPLAVCASTDPPIRWPDNPARVVVDGASIHVFGPLGASLWRSELPRRVGRAEVADLDGDGRNEIVVANGELLVFNAGGTRVWRGGGDQGMTVRKFVVANLFRKKDRQIVTLSHGPGSSASLLSIFDSKGHLLSAYSHPGPLFDVTVAALTARHGPKIIVTGANDQLQPILHVSGRVGSVFMLEPKDVRGSAPPYLLGAGTQLWYGTLLSPNQTIDRLTITDHDNDGQRDISLHTSARHTIHLDFDGHIIGTDPGVHFGLIAK